eukprot:augustus_masked-scaffold_45-processed-gene-0.3-mRNA-1 protein AED:1.00 eAED:1.00 QI:0/0/0/0/1/1/12/0/1692
MMPKSRAERIRDRERRKLEEEDKERRRKEQEEGEEGQEELFGVNSSSDKNSEEEEDDEAENAAEDNASEYNNQKADQVTATEANRVATGAPDRDDPMPDTGAECRAAPVEDEADNQSVVVEDEAETQSVVVEDEAEIMDLTQSAEAAKEVGAALAILVPNDEAALSDEALNIEKPTTLERCEFYLKRPRWFTLKKYMICEDVLREAQKKMKGKTAVEMLEEKDIYLAPPPPEVFALTDYCFGEPGEVVRKSLIKTAVQFMADRGMTVLRRKFPKPNLSANEILDHPRRIPPFKWVLKVKSVSGIAMKTPKLKVRPSEHTRTDVKNRLQKRIDTLTTANERIKLQSLGGGYISEHEVYEGEDTLRTIAQKVTLPSEGPFLERLNTYMSSATGCIKWKQLTENAQKFEVLKALNKRLPVELQMRDARLKVKLDASQSKFGGSLNKFKELIKSVYERKMDTMEEVDLSPPEPAVAAPRESEVRRTQQKVHRSSRKRRHSIPSDKERGRRDNKYYRRKSRSPSPRGYRRSMNRGRYFPHRNRGSYKNRRYERNEDRKPKQRDSFLALPAPGDEYKKRNPTRRINVSVRRAEKKDVTIHHIRSGDRISDAILDSGADESVASLHRHAWMMDTIDDVKEKMTLADGATDLRITKVGYTDLELRIGGIWRCDFRRVKIFLVDDKNWKELLVGAPALGKVCRSSFADSAAVVRALISEELGQLSGAYDMFIVELSLNLILGSISNFAEHGYTLAEIVKVVDEDAEGQLEAINASRKKCALSAGCKKAEISKAITKMVEAAGNANEDQRDQLMNLSFKYEDVFATSASQIGISLLPPMDVVPTQGAEFKKPAPWPLGPGKAEFVKEKLDGMVEKGMAKKIRQAIYGSVVFAVPKKNNTWHMVLDLVAVNRVLHRDVNILPILETQVVNTAPARFYGCLDVVSGFDQLAITDRAKKYFNLMTTYGVFQLQFAPMGYHSTPVFFHQRMVDRIAAANYNRKGNGIVQWIDDTLIHAKDFKRYIRILEDVLRNLQKWKARISPTKSILFTTGIEYCGGILQNGGWNFSKKYYEKILLVPKPEYVYELAKLLHLAQWLTSAVPEMTELRDKIMLFYPEMKGKKKKLLKEKKRILWNEELETAFKRFKQRLADAAKARLQHYDRNMDLILVTGAQLVWGICHKELYPIIRTFNKLPCLLPFHPTAVQVYTDHLNLKAILQGGSKINNGHFNRLQRWMVILQHVLVDIHHLDGDSNIFADMLTRWAAPTEESNMAAVRIVKMQTQNVETRVPVLARAEKRLRKISKMRQEETDAKIIEDDSLLCGEDRYFRIKSDFEGWTPDLLQPKNVQWVEGLEIDMSARYFAQPILAQQKRIVRGIVRKPPPPKDRADLMREVERQIRRKYTVEECRKLTENFATWPSEVPSDVSDTNKKRYIETDTYLTSEDEDNTTAKIRSVTARINHLRPKQQMEKKIYASLKSLDRYSVSVFNPYFKGDWAPLMEAENKRLVGKIILPPSLLERELVHIHLANKHGSLEADLAEAAKFEWRIPAAMESALRGDTPWKKVVELIPVFRDNCIHYHRLPKAIKTTYSLVTRPRRSRETLFADFLYVNRIGHILVLMDVYSRFKQLTHTKTPDMQAVIEALDKFATNYKLEKDFTLVTDRRSQFANSLMTVLRKELCFSQSFVVSYASWTNGEVEAVNKNMLNS